MFITTVPNRNSNPTILLRESYREEGKVHVRTLANLTHWPKEKVETLDAVLRGAKLATEDDFELLPGRAHGNVYAVLGTMRLLELENILGSRPCQERSLAMALVAGRVSNQAPAFRWRGLWPSRPGAIPLVKSWTLWTLPWKRSIPPWIGSFPARPSSRRSWPSDTCPTAS